MKIILFCLLAVFSLNATLHADDAPSSKTPTETKVEPAEPVKQGLAQKKTDIMEKGQDYQEVMRKCVTQKNDRAACRRETMAACSKSMSRTECKRALKRKY
jgi:hypothetical protein